MHDIALLKQLGLTPSAARCYLYLSEQQPLHKRASVIAAQVNLSQSNAQRALRELTRKGFVTPGAAIQGLPHIATWQARPLDVALGYYAAYQRELVEPLIRRWQS